MERLDNMRLFPPHFRFPSPVVFLFLALAYSVCVEIVGTRANVVVWPPAGKSVSRDVIATEVAALPDGIAQNTNRIAGAESAPVWLSGADLQKKLAQPISIAWTDNPLRDGLTNLSRAQRVAVLLDRRIDPGRKLSLTLDKVPLKNAFEEIARRRAMGFCMLGPVAYFGPPGAAGGLPAIANARGKDIGALPAAAKQQWRQTKSLAWADLATPREILNQLADQSGVALKGVERVPNDLWAAADLPPLPLADRLTLVLIQFDLTFEVSADGKTATLVPVPPAANDIANPKTALRKTPEKPAETKKPATTTADIGSVRITFTVRDVPLGKVLETIAKDPKLNLELKIDKEALAAAGASLDRPISVSVNNANVDEVLKEVMKDTRLKARRQGRTVEIGP
jgi:hypothetical protein